VGPAEHWPAQLETRDERSEHLSRRTTGYQSLIEKTTGEVHNMPPFVRHSIASPAWKRTKPAQRDLGAIPPRGSARGRLLRLAYRALAAVPELRHREYAMQKARAFGRAVSRARVAILRCPPFAWVGRFARRAALRRVARNLPRFPRFEQLAVSVVIPVHNRLLETLACIDSIARSKPSMSYEVIVVDDGSGDEIPATLTRVEGLFYIRNDTEQGFIASCNRGVLAARGTHVAFLNDDTVVTPGWLEALAATFQKIPGTGLAGAKLIYPDGRLQEAGAIIWRDASGWSYGNLDDPEHPRFNFAREVDYCSGTCIMVSRALFLELGGFDALYAPGHYEATDLAFKIRHAGHKVVYQPMARVIHHGAQAPGRSLKGSARAHQFSNQPRFRERWAGRLAAHPEPPKGPVRMVHAHGARQRAHGQILVIDHRIPFPDQDCGSARMMEILRAIRRRGHHVTFIPENLAVASPYVEEMLGIGVEVIHKPFYHSVEEFLTEHGRDFELAILSHGKVAARHMSVVKRLALRATVVFDTVDLQFLREERHAELTKDTALRDAALARRQQDLKLARQADRTLVVSPVEKAILEAECPGLDVQVLATIYPMDGSDVPSFEERRDIVFIGSFEHAPNVDGVLYFVSEILPKVRDRLPDIVFQVIGPEPTREIRRLASAYIKVHGHVPDVRPIFDHARVSVAPLRFGAGVKGKVNQSMSLGVPAIVTSIAAEGMHLVHEQNAMIADDASSFAEAVVRLCTYRELWEQVSANGRANVRQHFSVDAAARCVDELLAFAGLGPRATWEQESRRSGASC
jgi:GT2 family glycosyltransferase